MNWLPVQEHELKRHEYDKFLPGFSLLLWSRCHALLDFVPDINSVVYTRSLHAISLNNTIYFREKTEKSAGQETSRSTARSKKQPVPWRHILNSPPVWAVMICHVTYNWSWYSLITCMPTYMSRVLGFDMFDVSFSNAVSVVHNFEIVRKARCYN